MCARCMLLFVDRSQSTWHPAVGALGLVEQWWTTQDAIAEAAPRIIERFWRDRKIAFTIPTVIDTACSVIRLLQEQLFVPRGLCVELAAASLMYSDLGVVCPITPALCAYLYAAAPDETGQRVACIALSKTCGKLSPGVNVIWQSEPATLDLVMRIVHKRLDFLTNAIEIRQAEWEDASRLARALAVGQAFCSRGLSPSAPATGIVGMPAAVWLDAGRLAHLLRHLVPDEMHIDDKPGCADGSSTASDRHRLLFAVQDASRVAVTAVLICSMANDDTWVRRAIDAGLLESVRPLHSGAADTLSLQY